MKVQGIKTAEYGLPGARTVETMEEAPDASTVFRRTLTTLSGEQHTAHLQELVCRIDEQGAKLAQRADIKEFERYRQLIREFLDEVVSNGYSFTKDNAFGARGRHRFFATVKTIDQKLDGLAKEVLQGQADSLDLLNRIDDIRGLILDLMS